MVSTYAAGECRRQVKNLTNCVKNVKFVEFYDHVWNHHEKYIEINTNIPGIGSLIHEIAVTISETQTQFGSVKPMAVFLSAK